MLRKILNVSLIISIFYSNLIFADTLFEGASKRGINETCALYLGQVENSYDLQGLNITFAHPESPSLFPTLHISTQKFNNGASTFSATLIPDQDFCYLSTVFITAVNDQTCEDITKLKTDQNPNLQVSEYNEGAYTIITPSDSSYQVILASLGEKGCSINETRMMWPGR